MVRRAFQDGAPIKIVTGIRDPLDRAISIYFFLADFYGHRDRRLSHREQPDLDDLLAYFADSWRAALAGEPGVGTCDRWLRQELLRYRTWFEMELREVFDIDITAAPFDHDRSVLRLHRARSICSVSFRGPRPEAIRHAGMRKPARWSARRSPSCRAAMHEDRRAAELYRAFRTKLKLPAEMLDDIYALPIIHHLSSCRDRSDESALGGLKLTPDGLASGAPNNHIAKVRSQVLFSLRAGAPGFEPGITGPKPVALPLGHAPYANGGHSLTVSPQRRQTQAARAFGGVRQRLAASRARSYKTAPAGRHGV